MNTHTHTHRSLYTFPILLVMVGLMVVAQPEVGFGQVVNAFTPGCGNAAVASANCTAAIGNGAEASSSASIAIGENSEALGSQSMTFGVDAVASGFAAMAIFTHAIASGDNSLAIGYLVEASNTNSIVIGRGASNLVNGTANSLMMGMNSDVPSFYMTNAGGSGFSNIGIATINPISRLHVNGTIRTGTPTNTGSVAIDNTSGSTFSLTAPSTMADQPLILPVTAGVAGEILGLDAGGTQLKWLPGTSGGAGWLLVGNGGTTAGTNFLGTTDPVDLVFKTDNTEKVRVMSGGNVGIGTASPVGRLHVRNPSSGSPTDVVIDRNGTAQANLRFNTGSSAQLSRIGVNTTGNHLNYDMLQSSSDHIFSVNSGTEVMRVVGSTARVGIGTATPDCRLHVAGPITQLTVAQFNAVGSPADQHITIGNYTTGGGPEFEGYLKGKTDLNSNWGLTLIGEVTDGADNGTVPVMTFQTFKIDSGSMPVTRPLFQWRNAGSVHMLMLANGNLGIGSASPAEKLHVLGTARTTESTYLATSSGNVGIGTTSPSGKLHVNGTLFAALPATSATSMVVYNPTTDELIDGGASTIYFKENVEDLSFDKEAFLDLRPTNFNWKSAQGGQADVGLIAQEVMETFPELAYSGPKRTYFEDGSMLLDSMGIPVEDTTQLETWGVRYHKIPIYLMSIVKGQQEEIAEMRDQLTEMTQQVNNCCSSGPMHRVGETQGNATEVKEDLEEFILLGNDPNPFSDHTDIRFDASACNKCEIVIVDINGRIVKRIMTKGRTGTVRIYSSEIGTGYFVYSLIQDGQVLRSERMISAR